MVFLSVLLTLTSVPSVTPNTANITQAVAMDLVASRFIDADNNPWEGIRRIQLDIHNIFKLPLRFGYIWFLHGFSSTKFLSIPSNGAISYRVQSKGDAYGVEGILMLSMSEDEDVGIYFNNPLNSLNHHYIRYYYKDGRDRQGRFNHLKSLSVNANYPVWTNINGNLGLYSRIEGGTTVRMEAKVIGLQPWNRVV